MPQDLIDLFDGNTSATIYPVMETVSTLVIAKLFIHAASYCGATFQANPCLHDDEKIGLRMNFGRSIYKNLINQNKFLPFNSPITIILSVIRRDICSLGIASQQGRVIHQNDKIIY